VAPMEAVDEEETAAEAPADPPSPPPAAAEPVTEDAGVSFGVVGTEARCVRYFGIHMLRNSACTCNKAGWKRFEGKVGVTPTPVEGSGAAVPLARPTRCKVDLTSANRGAGNATAALALVVAK